MDGLHPRLAARTALSFLLLNLIQTSSVSDAQGICSGPPSVEFPENNTVGAVVANITFSPGMVLGFSPPMEEPNPFALQENHLTAAIVFDYETQKTHRARITCTDPTTAFRVNIVIVVVLTNRNDNPPVFSKNLYNVSVPELSPVGGTVGSFPAEDVDKMGLLYYSLTSASDYFELQSPTSPSILIRKLLDYDRDRNVSLTLLVQDTPLETRPTGSSFTATTTILVSILDIDNRPPWFQPCTIHEFAGATICQSAGYTGSVFLNEQQTGALALKPGPLHAIDGDSGINEEIEYFILSGNDDGVFEITANTGTISMLKPASRLAPISLTVMAAQKNHIYQFSTTTVTVSVQKRSLHKPKFQRPVYQAVITGVGSMALNQENMDQPLQILATDDDYASTGGLNPHIDYSIPGSSNFSIINGYLYMTKNRSDGTLTLQVVAKDMSNDDSATAEVSVEVKSGLTTTTSMPLNTSATTGFSTTTGRTPEVILSTTKPSSTSTTVPSSTSKGITSTTGSSTFPEGNVSTTNPTRTSQGSSTSKGITSTTGSSTFPEGNVSTTNPTRTSQGSSTSKGITSITGSSTFPEGNVSTTNPTRTSQGSSTSKGITSSTGSSTFTEGNVSTTDPSGTSEGNVSASTAPPPTDIVPPGGFRVEDMAALGATLGALLLICLLVIGVLVYRMQKGKADWRKIYETNMFRSNLGRGPGGLKEAMQYTNEAFQSDEDEGSMGSGDPTAGKAIPDRDVQQSKQSVVYEEDITKSLAPLYDLLSDNTSQKGSDKSESEKVVKPILTKERRMEDGYKAVWFKGDIDPNAKEDVLIIPDSREDDSEEEDQSLDGGDEAEYDDKPRQSPKVGFTDMDLDSGVGVKLDDSEDYATAI